MKKGYIEPQTEAIQLDIHGMLAASPPELGGGQLSSRDLDDIEEWNLVLKDY